MTTTTPSVATESHWQAGCDDAKAGRGPRRPHPNNEGFGLRLAYIERLANQGYMNGHRFGCELRKQLAHQPSENEGSEP